MVRRAHHERFWFTLSCSAGSQCTCRSIILSPSKDGSTGSVLSFAEGLTMNDYGTGTGDTIFRKEKGRLGKGCEKNKPKGKARTRKVAKEETSLNKLNYDDHKLSGYITHFKETNLKSITRCFRKVWHLQFCIEPFENHYGHSQS